MLTTETYTLSLHDALPIWLLLAFEPGSRDFEILNEKDGIPPFNCDVLRETSDGELFGGCQNGFVDRKSTRLNSSHVRISYAVFCLKKKTIQLHCRELWVC